jgi:DNA-binding response OmpR family regulator
VNEIVTRDTILFSIWGDNDYFIGRSLDVFIAKTSEISGSRPIGTNQQLSQGWVYPGLLITTLQ